MNTESQFFHLFSEISDAEMTGITCNSKFNSLSDYPRKPLRLFRSVLHLSYAASNDFLLLSANIRIMYRCPHPLISQNLTFMYHSQVHHKTAQISTHFKFRYNLPTTQFRSSVGIRIYCSILWPNIHRTVLAVGRIQ
jgi:hypothetical protein